MMGPMLDELPAAADALADDDADAELVRLAEVELAALRLARPAASSRVTCRVSADAMSGVR